MGLQVSVDCLSGHAQALGNCRAVVPLQEAHHQERVGQPVGAGAFDATPGGPDRRHHGRWNAQGLGDGGAAVSLSTIRATSERRWQRMAAS
jgi:hypothetical protein